MHFDIAQLTCDINSRRILSAIDAQPRSVKEIARICGLTQARCYRMVKEMEHMHILYRAEYNGREIFYASNLRSMEFALEGDKLSVRVNYRDGSRKVVEMGPDDLEKAPSPQLGQDLLGGNDSREPSTAS